MARICIEKATGKLIEYQSDATPGTLLRNAVVGGYLLHDIEELIVTPVEWAAIYEAQIAKPLRERQAAKLANKRAKQKKVQQRLGLSDDELVDLLEAFGD